MEHNLFYGYQLSREDVLTILSHHNIECNEEDLTDGILTYNNDLDHGEIDIITTNILNSEPEYVFVLSRPSSLNRAELLREFNKPFFESFYYLNDYVGIDVDEPHLIIAV